MLYNIVLGMVKLLMEEHFSSSNIIMNPYMKVRNVD